MSIPNGAPQSPMWFSLTTVWPTRSSNLTSESPIIVDRRVTDVHLLGCIGRRVVDYHCECPRSAP